MTTFDWLSTIWFVGFVVLFGFFELCLFRYYHSPEDGRDMDATELFITELTICALWPLVIAVGFFYSVKEGVTEFMKD